MNRRHILAGLLAAATLPVTRGALAQGGPKEFRVGYQKTGVLVITRQQGILERRLGKLGIAVKWIEFTSGPPLLEAMNVGSVDLGARVQVGREAFVDRSGAGNLGGNQIQVDATKAIAIARRREHRDTIEGDEIQVRRDATRGNVGGLLLAAGSTHHVALAFGGVAIGLVLAVTGALMAFGDA